MGINLCLVVCTAFIAFVQVVIRSAFQLANLLFSDGSSGCSGCVVFCKCFKLEDKVYFFQGT